MVDKQEPKRELKPVSKNNFLNKIMYKSNKHCSDTTKKRVNEIILSLLIKDWETLKQFSFDGLPDEMPLLRSLLWKMNLKYLNHDYDHWDDFLYKKRTEYNGIKDTYMLKLKVERKIFIELEKERLILEKERNKPIKDNDINNNKEDSNKKQTSIRDADPLVVEAAIKDKKLLEEIDQDIRRTHSYMHFFFMPSKKSVKVSNEELAKVVEFKKQSETSKAVEEIYKKNETDWETNSDVLVRILFIYAKMHPEIKYVQGMNEILAPIYYCFFSEEENTQSLSEMDELDIQKENDYKYIPDVEADTYWTFSNLMQDIKLLFIQDSDNKTGGVFCKIKTLSEILKIVDKDIYNHLIKIKLDIQLIAFKWVVLLFTQDFLMPNILRLWDALLSETDRFYMVYLICIAILHLKKKEIMKSDFAGAISKLQKINNMDCDKILHTAKEIRIKYEKKIKKVYK